MTIWLGKDSARNAVKMLKKLMLRLFLLLRTAGSVLPLPPPIMSVECGAVGVFPPPPPPAAAADGHSGSAAGACVHARALPVLQLVLLAASSRQSNEVQCWSSA